MPPVIVSWPGGAFPTANTVVKGGARKKSTRKAKKGVKGKKARTMKQRKCGYRRTCA